MTVVRLARAGELPALTAHPDDDERNAATAAYLEKLLAVGCTRPGWCLVAESEGTLVGNIVLWTVPGEDVPRDVVLFEPFDEPTGELLLAAAADLAAGLGARTQGHVIDAPAQAPQFQRDPALRERLLAGAGFILDRDGRRFSWTAGTPVPGQDPRLTWSALADIGAEPFVDLLEEILADTKDSIFLADVARLGLRGAAEELWTDMAGFEHEPAWYEIGYAADGTTAVVSLPARNPTFPVIGFVGVSPRHRGQGYAAAAVARGTKILVDNGATEIRGDCDAGNFGMTNGFQRSGYANFANRRMFSRKLTVTAS